MRLAVAGATGQLGRRVAATAEDAGHRVVRISRATGVDLTTGAGLPEALRGVDAVIDASSTGSMRARESIEFFGAVTRHLLAAEEAEGVPHHVAVSIVGAARLGAGYYAGKRVQEELVTGRPGGWSLLRTTQFHGFVRQLIPAGRLGPIQLVPTMRAQPVAVDEVAAELVRIASGAPLGVVRDLAGPREERMAELVARYLRATGERRRVLQLPFPGAWGRGMRDGSLLPGPDAGLGTQTFDDWLRVSAEGADRD
ncbi:SDR family oxidoreductase [Leucobacter allii]|uniref:SDR family oxidoreductase n=1 Tax=Leucobacter allii TaxID=2932247 RepID=A0ABY4FHR3_9MICO|nr:SDR family oxidoreductase [Leucobacter allii]UOQ56038.1 SDR family oxidoreductase [Leucobacter allii]